MGIARTIVAAAGIGAIVGVLIGISTQPETEDTADQTNHLFDRLTIAENRLKTQVSAKLCDV